MLEFSYVYIFTTVSTYFLHNFIELLSFILSVIGRLNI